ncbi:MAG: hypothetical protein JXR76_13745 [Deltaproteobacteria bacterium]|nr:hypothetical protein [Deltaproteobacteria bacterium]
MKRIKEIYRKRSLFSKLNNRYGRTDNNFVARLLSQRNDVTIQEKEQVLENVLQRLSEADRAHTGILHVSRFTGIRRLSAIGALVMLCALGCFLWLRFSGSGEIPAFTSKSGGPLVSFFEVRCLNEDSETGCVQGSRLTFSFRDIAVDSYFSAFAIRKSDALVIWMFPGQMGEKSIAVSQHDKILSEAIVLDDLYSPGIYEIVGILGDYAMNRDEIKTLVLASAQQETTVRTTLKGPGTRTRISRVKIDVEDQ